MRRRLAALLLPSLVGTLLVVPQDSSPAVKRVVGGYEKLSIPEQIDALEQMRHLLDRNLLTPTDTTLKEHKKLLRQPEVFVNRLLNRGPHEGLTVGRGGGCYFSFTTQSNDYDQEPDLQLEQWAFSSGFAGGDRGYVVQLEEQSLAGLTAEHLPVWMQISNPNELAQQPRENAECLVGAVYAVRSIRWDESDLIAVFQVLDQDDRGVTFAWKVVARFAVPERAR